MGAGWSGARRAGNIGALLSVHRRGVAVSAAGEGARCALVWLAGWLAGLRLPCFGRLLLQPATVLRCSAVWCGALYLL